MSAPAQPRHIEALDVLALRLAAALGIDEVARRTTFAQQTTALGQGLRLMAALPNGRSAEIGYLMGAARPFEVEHTTRLIVGAVGGAAEDRAAAAQFALQRAALAIEADVSLGGLVADIRADAGDWQDVAEDAGPAVTGGVLDIILLIESETALG